MKPDFHVLIIGGGNCGLAIATGLKKHGIKYTLFEREIEHDYFHRMRDWGMLLHWGYEYLHKVLPSHLQARIKEPRVDPTEDMNDPIPYLDAISGEVIKYVPTSLINRVSRRKLRRFLTEGEDLNIVFGKKMQRIELVGDEQVEVVFEDGTSYTGSLVLGADGSHSKVRSFLLGEEAARCQEVGHTMINTPVSGYTPEQAHLLRSVHPIVQLCYHSSVGVGLLAALDIPDPEDTSQWAFQSYVSWWGPPYAEDLKDQAVRMKFFKERMSKFCEPFRTGALALKDDADLPVFSAGQWAPTMKWDNYGGRVALAGDAAHPMLPHRGQGLNHALRDACELVDALVAVFEGRSSLAEAITAYDEEMRPRGAKEVALTFEQALATRTGELEKSPIFRIGHSNKYLEQIPTTEA